MDTTVAILPRPRKSWRETALGLPICLQLEVGTRTIRSSARRDLANAVATAVELNRSRAARKGVRLHAYVVDQAISVATQSELVAKFDKLLGQVISSARFGSAVTCRIGIVGGEVKVHVCRARPGSDEFGVDLDMIDEFWSWCAGGTNGRVH